VFRSLVLPGTAETENFLNCLSRVQNFEMPISALVPTSDNYANFIVLPKRATREVPTPQRDARKCHRTTATLWVATVIRILHTIGTCSPVIFSLQHREKLLVALSPTLQKVVQTPDFLHGDGAAPFRVPCDLCDMTQDRSRAVVRDMGWLIHVCPSATKKTSTVGRWTQRAPTRRQKRNVSHPIVRGYKPPLCLNCLGNVARSLGRCAKDCFTRPRRFLVDHGIDVGGITRIPLASFQRK